MPVSRGLDAEGEISTRSSLSATSTIASASSVVAPPMTAGAPLS